jgi:hypothetical protein
MDAAVTDAEAAWLLIGISLRSVEAALLVPGIVWLIRGRMMLGRKRYIESAPGRMAGLLLILPVPTSFVVGTVVGVLMMMQGKEVNAKSMRVPGTIIEVTVLVGCFIASIIVFRVWAKPLPAKASGPETSADRNARSQV